MLDLFAPIKCLLRQEPVHVDNVVFRLHSRVTVLLLLVCTILVTAKQYIGEPISCMTDSSIDKEPVNAYCWIYSTFTVIRHLKGVPGRGVASAGVGQALPRDEAHHHRYYQWVCFVLGLQAILFYVPRALWTIWERGTIGLLSRNLETPFLGEVWTAERKRQLVEYFTRTNLHSHNFYAIRFFVCELLNCLNSMGQIYALDVFLEGQFRRYGPLVSAFVAEKNPHDRIDPMARLFPKVTKCTIHTFGPAGSVQTHDALCVLPLNVVNEKIFVVLWFWLVFLACVGCLAVIYRIVVFSQRWTRVYLLRGAVRVLERSKAECVVRVFHFGDWFLLYQLAQNVNPIVYRELVNEIAEAFARKSFADFV
ncbi:innexin inx2-like isoform X2 [Pseudomyrmex gracilis]|uniref:innexin inx2-like isoform X2 n=1 Tax=Pseudomyrmex gracilis TaxID=219809 RepID=UPI000994E398|nr:innexin inx2-like isoform X2 [Pseudomyrmex gracilis]